MTTAILAAVSALAGCGGGGEEEADQGRLVEEAAAVVEQLERGLAEGQYARVCSELFSAEVRRQAGGGDCPAQLERTSAGVEQPDIEIERIQIRGNVAVVDVVTTAEGQAPVEDTIRLVREAGGYRISSLSG